MELVEKLPTRWLGEAKTPQMGKFGGSPEKITPTLPGLEGEREGGEAEKRRFCEENRARSAGLELERWKEDVEEGKELPKSPKKKPILLILGQNGPQGLWFSFVTQDRGEENPAGAPKTLGFNKLRRF